MRKLCISVSLALACSISVAAQSKLDARGQVAVAHYNQVMLHPDAQIVEPGELPFKLDPNSRSEAYGTVIILPAEGVTAEDIEAYGFEIKYEIGDQYIASASIADIDALAKSDLVKAMTFGGKAKTYLDVARDVTGVTAIHNGDDGLPHAFTGKGVIAGIFDTGCDPNHIAFRGDDTENPRVKRVWHFGSNDGSYTTYDTPRLISGFTTDNNADFHGTHTLGCMAGSFNGRAGKVAMFNGDYTTTSAVIRNPFYGTAPGSDIALACGSLYDPNIIGAVKNCVDYAKSVGKPVVINLSIGTNIGSHDGRDQTARALEELGKEAIICIAAGNEGSDNNTIVAPLTADKSQFKTLLNAQGGAAMTGSIDIWASDNQPLKITPIIYDIETKEIIFSYPTDGDVPLTYITSSYYTVPEYLHFEEFDKAFKRSSITIRGGVNEANNRYNYFISYALDNNTYSNKNGNLVFGFIAEGVAGQRVDVTNVSNYCRLSDFGLEDFTNGTSDLSISSMGCSDKLLTVGAWNTREHWGVISNSTYGYRYVDEDPSKGSMLPKGQLASYSSYGQTYDGRNYPLVCAPGSGIISAVNTHYFTNAKGDYKGSDRNACASYTEGETTYIWDASQGTSMATPIVAGAIATWLEANPTLTTEDVVNIIKETSDKDQYTSIHPERWGYGKFNALAGLKKVLALGAVNDVIADNSSKLLVTAAGENAWEVFLPGADAITAKLYSTSGAVVAQAESNSDNLTINGSHLTSGVYILNVNGAHSQRVLVK